HMINPIICQSLVSFIHLRPPISTLFPYTTLFRSRRRVFHTAGRAQARPLCRARDHEAVGCAFCADRAAERTGDTGCERGTRSARSEEHTSELQSQSNLVCRLLLEKKKKIRTAPRL